MLLSCLLLCSTSALAHDHWLETSPGPGAVKVEVHLGEHLTAAEPYHMKEPGRYTRFDLVSARALRSLIPALRVDADTLARFRAQSEERGTLALVVDGAPRDITLEHAAFDAYLAEEGLDAITALRGEGPARERYTRHLKNLFARGAPGGEVATRVMGQALEIVPIIEPLTAPEGDEVAFCVLFGGAPLVGARVLAARRGDDGQVATWVSTTDGAGAVRFVLAGEGLWLVRLVHMIPLAEPDADWRSYWASLTLQRG